MSILTRNLAASVCCLTLTCTHGHDADGSVPSPTRSPQPTEARQAARDFADPPARFWPRPLWFWNDTQVTVEGVKEQMLLARDRSHYGGFGILPFGRNFRPPYLSDEYFAVYGAALDQAKALGLTLSLYDEYGFPSGSAGSQNSSDKSLFAQRWPELTIKRLDKREWLVEGPARFQTNLPQGNLQAVVAMNTNTLERVNLSDTVREGRLDWKAPAGPWKVMSFVCVKDGDPICDYLDPEAADRFIEITHQAYYNRFASHFGTTIASTFFDEPTLYRAAGRSWTDRFNEKFQACYGFDPRPYYPALWCHIGPDTEAARNYLFGFRTELYANGFTKRVQDWSAAHGIKATGHQDQEEVVNPVSVSGDLMKCFEHLEIPGIDKIGGDRPAERFYKIVSSAAYNYDRSLVMSETYGAMGDLSWDAIYTVAMEQYTKGINLLIPHAVWYDDKRVTFKPELSWRQPLYAGRLPEFNTYVGRLNVMLQNEDAHVADIAVLYPIATLQGSHRLDGPLGFYQGGVAVPEADYVGVGELLSVEVGRDYTFLHPEVLDRKCAIQGSVLSLTNRVHPGRFRVMILPGHKTIAWRSLAKIQAFYEAGGCVLATGQLPSKSAEFGHDAEVARAVEAMFGSAKAEPAGPAGFDLRRHARGGCAIRLRKLDGETLRQALDAAQPSYDVAFAPNQTLRYIHKTSQGRHVYFFANLNPRLSESRVTLRGRHELEAWDPHTGRIQAIECGYVEREGTELTQLSLALPYLKSVFLVTKRSLADASRSGATETAGKASARDDTRSARWPALPDPREVQLGGTLGRAFDRGAARLAEDPYRSAAFLRSDISFETNRMFVNYSGDISGRFLEIASLLSPPGRMSPSTLPEVLRDIGKYQRADGHFGRDVNWNEPLEPENSNARLLPIFWGNSRLLLGLIEAFQAFGRPDLLEAARKIGDFYIGSSGRFLDPKRLPEYQSTGTYAAGYVTDYFPGIEGLVRLYLVTKDTRYLDQAERMAEFFRQFDKLPIDHSHGHLATHRGLLWLYQATGKPDYLERVRKRWREAVEGGYIWPLGGVGERFRVSYPTDEGCSESDWLQLNVQLWRLTGDTRCLDMADRLLWNHYAMNRTANGGYGHHNFVCDSDGPLLMKPEFTEAVWCCTFHGLLGLQVFKSHVLASTQRGLLINFPVAFSASITNAGVPWRMAVDTSEDYRSLSCRVRLDSAGPSAQPPRVGLRVPAWADKVTVTDSRGATVSALKLDGYCLLPVQPGAAGEVTATFSWGPRLEDRRLSRCGLAAGGLSRQRGVVIFNGPRLLMANTNSARPTLVALVERDGRLRLSFDRSGTARAAVVPSVEASEAQIIEALKGKARLQLSPWEQIRQDAAAAFVFDLVAVPQDSPMAAEARDSAGIRPIAPGQDAPAGQAITVAQDGSGAFSNVQAAIDAAPPHGLIRIGPGVFEETLVIDKPITLEGAGWQRTLLRKDPGPDLRSDEDLARFLEPELRKAVSDRHRNAIFTEFMRKRVAPILTVRDTSQVQIRGLRLTNPRLAGGGGFSMEYLLVFTNAQALCADCAVSGGPGCGVLIGKDAEVELRHCLVAGFWGDGIQAGERTGAARQARIVDCDIRNCHNNGIDTGTHHEPLIVERCRISGSAYHGIHYGDSSPAIASNIISAHGVSGIAAAGASAAVIRQNVIHGNENSGVFAWVGNRDLIEGNTFVDNLGPAVILLAAASPVLRSNIFSGHPAAISRQINTQKGSTADTFGAPVVEHNLFWSNQTNWHGGTNSPAAVAAGAASRLDILANPGFKDPARFDFASAPDSAARREGVGALAPISFSSPWPLQPEELAIVPDGKSRGYKEWKDLLRLTRQTKPTATAAQAAGAANAPAVSCEEALRDLYEVLGREYPCFKLKSIDWAKVGAELLPRARLVKTDEEFGLLCMELVAQLRDTHSYLLAGIAQIPAAPVPRWDPGFACLLGERQEPVIYYVDQKGPAARNGVCPGMTVLSINGTPAAQVLANLLETQARYIGYSSDRYARYDAAQSLGKQMQQGASVRLETLSVDGRTNVFNLPATLGIRYFPRLPVPIRDIRDSGDVSWTRVRPDIGYIYVRRIGQTLIARLDQAVGDLKDVRGLIVDVRGNSGGGFEGVRALRNFSLTDRAEPERPRYAGPVALLIDARTVSAAEGWASWFVREKRARIFGEATAGASSRKDIYTLKNGLYRVQYMVKPYTGFLDRVIEQRGLEPDVPLRQRAADLAVGRDTVLEAAVKFLEAQTNQPPQRPPTAP